VSAQARRLRQDAGFTLVEVMVAAGILLVGVLGVLTLINTANANTYRTKVRDGATGLGREVIEAARAVPYPDLSQDTVLAQLQAQPGLSDTTGDAVWHIQRRGITYTVAATVCSVDGGADGFGAHAGGTFCTDSSTTGTGDPDPDDYKRVGVDVTWSSQGKTVKVRQEAVLNDPGSAFAPSVIAMTCTPTTMLTAATVSCTNVKTSQKAQSVRWYVDNVQRGTASGSGTTWSFSWDPSAMTDGTYLVRAQAYDKYGQTGSGYIVTIQLNRNVPQAPTGVVGGRNPLWGSNTVELEWNPSPERDVTGYQVWRVTGGSVNLANDVKVCETKVTDATATSCIDANAPTGNQRYYVLAVAPARGTSGNETSALPAYTSTLQSDVPNNRPIAPTTVTATALAGGGVQLSWTASADPDLTPIRYYRIYRDDATSFTGRYDITDTGAIVTWSDTSPNASSHRYWVTAVDDHLAESPLGPPGGIQP
jgi:prepilin-type N-terminal cleavage/methylation domain-containing protein